MVDENNKENSNLGVDLEQMSPNEIDTLVENHSQLGVRINENDAKWDAIIHNDPDRDDANEFKAQYKRNHRRKIMHNVFAIGGVIFIIIASAVFTFIFYKHYQQATENLKKHPTIVYVKKKKANTRENEPIIQEPQKNGEKTRFEYAIDSLKLKTPPTDTIFRVDEDSKQIQLETEHQVFNINLFNHNIDSVKATCANCEPLSKNGSINYIGEVFYGKKHFLRIYGFTNASKLALFRGEYGKSLKIAKSNNIKEALVCTNPNNDSNASYLHSGKSTELFVLFHDGSGVYFQGDAQDMADNNMVKNLLNSSLESIDKKQS